MSADLSSHFNSENLTQKILYIQKSVDPDLRLILDPNWNSKNSNYRKAIRDFLAFEFSAHFSREQLALLNDLNWLPQASDGYFSISHCRKMGGFLYSKISCGFDVEEIKRISTDILKRTSSEDELQIAHRTEFLWVAKEAGFKAHAETASRLVISDLHCTEWNSHFENQLFSFRLKSEKALDFRLNKGFIFSESDCLLAVYFK